MVRTGVEHIRSSWIFVIQLALSLFSSLALSFSQGTQMLVEQRQPFLAFEGARKALKEEEQGSEDCFRFGSVHIQTILIKGLALCG